MTFRLASPEHCWARRSFSAITKARVLYVCIIQLIVWLFGRQGPGLLLYTLQAERKNIESNAVSKWAFRVKYNLLHV